jgi:AbrB family looped-hinge helix DNA binding protein
VVAKLYFLEVKMAVVSKVSSKNQVTLPKEVRDRLGIGPGDTVLYDIVDEKVILHKVEPFDRQFHSALGRTLQEWSSSEDEEAFRDL